MINLTGLPLQVQQDIEHEINRNPSVVQYREAMRDYQKRGKFLEAMRIGAMLAEVEEKVKQGMMVKHERMGNIYKSMTSDEIETINTACNTIIMLSDIIETQVMEINQTVKKHFPDYRVDMYDRFVQIGREAKEQLRYMTAWTNNLYQIKFGDVADELTEMITNKVRKLLRKVSQIQKGDNR